MFLQHFDVGFIVLISDIIDFWVVTKTDNLKEKQKWAL
jgi:hypothetical protein